MRLELHTGDLADLAFLRADSVDVAFSDGALGADRGPRAACSARCTACCATARRSSSRSRTRSCSAPRSSRHPRARCRSAAPTSPAPTSTARPIDVGTEGESLLLTRHTLTEVFTGLTRTGFRVDTLLEPEPARTQGGRALLPDAVIWRARKEGS